MKYDHVFDYLYVNQTDEVGDDIFIPESPLSNNANISPSDSDHGKHRDECGGGDGIIVPERPPTISNSDYYWKFKSCNDEFDDECETDTYV